MKKRFALSLTALAGALCAVSPALALPAPSKSPREPITTLLERAKTDSRLAGVDFYIDSDDSHTVWVSPANRKTQGGVFQSALPAQCDKVAQMYDLAYLLPTVPAAQYPNFIRTNPNPFSPFFELTYGAPMRNGTLLQGIATRVGQQQRILDANVAQKVAYDTNKGIYDDAVAKRDAAQARIDSYQQRIQTLTATMSITMDPMVQQEIASQIRELQAERAEKQPEMNEALRTSQAAVDIAFPAYNTARAAWQRFDVDLTRLATETEQVQRILENLMAVYKQGFETAETTLNNFQGAVAGYASAAYTIYDQEVTAANEALAGLRDAAGRPTNYHAVKLPLWDVQLAPQIADTTVSVASRENNSPVLPRTDGFDTGPNPGTITPMGTMTPVDTGFSNPDGTPLTSTSGNAPQARLLGVNQGAGSYRAIVTRGALCAGTSTAKTVNIAAPYDIGDGVARTEDITKPVYTPRPSNVLAQSVGLNYTYYVQSAPAKVSCTMEVSKFVKFVQQQSSKHVLWWSKKSDTATRTQRAAEGITCNVTVQPVTGDPAADAAFIRGLEAQYTREMGEDFLRLAANSWDTQKINDTDSLLPAARKPGAALASRIKCSYWDKLVSGGACSLSKASIRFTDEIFGAQEGRKALTDSLKVTIKRNYAERTYRREAGSAAIDLVVPVTL